MRKQKFDIGNVSDVGGGFAMNMKRIGLIIGAHVVAIGVFYLVGSSGGSDDSDGAVLAGANGLKIWDSQSPDAQEPTVDPSSMAAFDSRAGDLSGYNAGDASRSNLIASSSGTRVPASTVSGNTSFNLNTAPVVSNRGRYEPQRPSDYSGGAVLNRDSAYQNNDGVLYSEPTLPPKIVSYTVAKGDSIWGIGRKFNVTTKQITDANPGLKVNTIRVGQKINIPQPATRGGSLAGSNTPVAQQPVVTEVDGSTYVVRSGDSLSRIAASQGTTLTALRMANGLKDDLIRVGQKLRIPNVSTTSESIVSERRRGLRVVVKSGDSVSAIANRHGVSQKALMTYNDIADPRRLQVGQVLYIPGTSETREIEDLEPPAQVTRDTRPPAQTTPAPTRTIIEEEPSPAPLPTIAFEDDSDLLDEDQVEAPVIPIED
ncbi:MAG: LysM peptidoglycan-binding domain-containing protein [Verrucomicrobiota bacterium]